MEELKKIAEELFGNVFTCNVSSDGITFMAKDNSKTYRIKENIDAIKRFEEVANMLQPLFTKYKIPQGDVFFKGAIISLLIETLCNPAKDLDSIFESTLNGYEEVEKELPGMFKDQYLVTLELLKYFREQKKSINHQ
jgi:hypothetical protein